MMFEKKSEPLISHRAFLGRVARCGFSSALLVVVSLGIGMTGYRGFERLSSTCRR